MLIRVRAKDGMARIECQPTDKMTTIAEKVAEHFNIPLDEQRYSRDPGGNQMLLLARTKSLKTLGLLHGDLIYCHYDREIEGNTETSSKKYNPTESLRDLKKNWTMKEFLEYREKVEIRIKAQEQPHAKSVALDAKAAFSFQSYMQQISFGSQRLGIMYGRVTEEKEVEVDVIYEPPQEGSFDTCMILEGTEEIERADKIADFLGLKRVGLVLGTYPRDCGDMSSLDVIRSAEFQNKYGEHCVTVVASLLEDGQTSFEAYQVSDQCVDLVKEGIFSKWDDPEVLETNEVVYVDKKGFGRQETKEVDPLFFIVPVPIKQREGMFTVKFPIENRASPADLTHLKKLLQDSSQSLVQKLADFHALLFVTQYLDMKADIPTLCTAVCSKDGSALGGFELILKNYAGIHD